MQAYALIRLAGALTGVILLGALVHFHYSLGYFALTTTPFEVAGFPIRHRHIAITTTQGGSEFYGPLAWTMTRVLNQQYWRSSSVQLYVPQSDFLALLQREGMLQGSTSNPGHFLRDLAAPSLFYKDPGMFIDMVVLGSCEADMDRLGDQLLKIWDERPQDRKFTVVCGVHDVNINQWFKHIREWSRRGAIRILPISEHVASRFWRIFRDMARDDPMGFYEHIHIDPFHPIANLTFPPKMDHAGVVSSAAILGNYQQDDLDYTEVFSALEKLVNEDPTLWGYLQRSEGQTVYSPDQHSDLPPFELHIFEYERPIHVPEPLSRVVSVHRKPDVEEFYGTIHAVDMVIPAFATEENYNYRQASFAIHTAVECNVPVLVTRPVLQAYSYLPHDATILRPMIITEMESIRLLRSDTKKPVIHLIRLGPKQFDLAVERLQAEGHRRAVAKFDAIKDEVWKKNELIVSRMLRAI